MFNTLSLAKRIHIVLVLIAVSLLMTTILFFYSDEKQLSEDFVKRNLESMALNYFDAVNTMMLTGTIANRQIIQDKILSQDDIIEARIIRAPALTKLFGTGASDQNPQSDFETEGLNGTKAYKLLKQNGKRVMSFIMPVRASDNYRGTNCLSCHQVPSGQILGAVKVTYDLTNVDKEIVRSITQAGILQLVITIIGFALLSLTFHKLVLARLKKLRNTINSIEKDLDLTQEINVTHYDELGAVSTALNSMLVKFKDSFTAVSSATDKLINSAQHVDEISCLTKDAMHQNKQGTESVAAAINELDATATDVQKNTKAAADKSESAREKGSQSLQLVERAKEGINQLRDQVIENTDMISELSGRTNEVGSVLDVITGIAEQTNLLALNAAIEAARAGEQGRGFAVVADEVRSLATRTRESINQIQDTISALQVDAGNAVDSMKSVSHQASEKAEDVTNVAGLLVDITGQINELEELNCQIASAAKQQNLAADEINVNVINISDVAEKSTLDAVRGKEISEQLLELAYELSQQLSKFKY